jgi:hypothetical protein
LKNKNPPFPLLNLALNESRLDCFWLWKQGILSYFIEYNVHTSILRIWISQWFLAKILFLFFKNNFTRINHCKFIHHKSHLKPFLSYYPCIVCREYFSIIFNVKKCALCLIKYGNCGGRVCTVDLLIKVGCIAKKGK